jgi:segregation and condensation protein B
LTGDECQQSLADQAAAWVPPWDRPAAGPPPADAPPEGPPPVESADDVETAPDADLAQADATGTAPDTGVTAVVDDAGTDPGEGADDGGGPTPDAHLAEQAPETESAEESAGREPRPPEAESSPESATPISAPRAAEPSAPASTPETARRRSSALALIDDELRGALEAILLVVDEPVAEVQLAQVLEQPTERVVGMLDRRGFELRRAAGGWRLYTRPEYATYVERFVLDGQSVRLTQAALETLAVVAYKQPVTRSRVSAIRGVNCDGVIRTLVTRGLIEECGTEPESGAYLYRTTTLFLEKLGLNTVDELPPLAPFLPDNVEEIADVP